MNALEQLVSLGIQVNDMTPEAARSLLRDQGDVVDQAVREAFRDGGLRSDPERVFALLDDAKSLVLRRTWAEARLRQVRPDVVGTGASLFFTATKPWLLRDFLNLSPRSSRLIISFFQMRSGEVWAACVRQRRDGRISMLGIPVITPDRAGEFGREMRGWIESLNCGEPNIALCESILGQLGSAVFATLTLTEYPEEVIIIPHRQLHSIPLQAMFMEREGQRYYLDDACKSSFCAASVFELVWTLWSPEGVGDCGEYPRFMNVLPGGSDLPWVGVERSFFGLQLDSGLPIDIVCDIKGLPKDLRPYARISWSSHASSCVSSWGGSSISLGDESVSARNVLGWSLPKHPTVVLSACETSVDASVGEVADDYCGLDLAFRVAGAGAVVGTLWRVADHVAAVVNMLSWQYMMRDHSITSVYMAELRRSLRSGAWRSHLMTEEQLDDADIPDDIKGRMAPVLGAMLGLSDRDLSGLDAWACFRCVGA